MIGSNFAAQSAKNKRPFSDHCRSRILSDYLAKPKSALELNYDEPFDMTENLLSQKYMLLTGPMQVGS